MKLKIEVLQEDIDLARYSVGNNFEICPIAQTFKRQFPDIDKVTVFSDTIITRYQDVIAIPSLKMRKYIANWDNKSIALPTNFLIEVIDKSAEKYFKGSKYLIGKKRTGILR